MNSADIHGHRTTRPRDHDAVQAVQRSTRCIDGLLEREMARRGISLPQYNVLRIVRDAGDPGLATLLIATRMLDRAPGITRLLDRLQMQGLVRRHRGRDRRQVLCSLTAAGAELLATLDPLVAGVKEDVLSALTPNEVGALIHLLDRVCATAGRLENQGTENNE